MQTAVVCPPPLRGGDAVNLVEIDSRQFQFAFSSYAIEIIILVQVD